ncbi:DUF72 domain-containing protein [Aquabacterium sp. J223]|uniref:DUF72 domain-containing protein n=1 Tax=Aquabacterium sp. J223 TaxID=2898431 RepID=UPI0021ADC9B0|nr:DUF72 domain-containing protein [Aquabacterium sp. J223]UUX95908.1 DUF72 domain-containing protein [Aquabacterium sp. J223]
MGSIRVGIGGWTFEPWEQTFYPPGLPAAQHLAHASRRVTAIEVNGTFYRTQSPSSFQRWHDETPDGFVFSVKANRACTQRKVLAEAGEAVARFLGSGLDRLGDKLGPVLWQLPPYKRYDEADLEAFLGLLPPALKDRPLRHVLEVRHPSFLVPRFVEQARRHGAAVVATDSPKYPQLAEPTAGFLYLRLMRSESAVETGYPAPQLDQWAACARAWAAGLEPADVPRVAGVPPAEPRPRDVFVFFIDGAKERAPAAAQAVLDRLRTAG